MVDLCRFLAGFDVSLVCFQSLSWCCRALFFFAGCVRLRRFSRWCLAIFAFNLSILLPRIRSFPPQQDRAHFFHLLVTAIWPRAVGDIKEWFLSLVCDPFRGIGECYSAVYRLQPRPIIEVIQYLATVVADVPTFGQTPRSPPVRARSVWDWPTGLAKKSPAEAGHQKVETRRTPTIRCFCPSGPTLRHLFHPSQDGASHSLRKCGRATDTFGGGATH